MNLYQKASMKVKFKQIMMVTHANIVIRNLVQEGALTYTLKPSIIKRSMNVNNVIIRQHNVVVLKFMCRVNMKALNTNVNIVIIKQSQQIIFKFMCRVNMKALNTNVSNVFIKQPQQVVFKDI